MIKKINLDFLIANGWTCASEDKDNCYLTHPKIPSNVKLTIEQAIRRQAEFIIKDSKEIGIEKFKKAEKTISEQLKTKGWIYVDGLWYHPHDEFLFGIENKKIAIKIHRKRKFICTEISEQEKEKLILRIRYKKSLEEILRLIQEK